MGGNHEATCQIATMVVIWLCGLCCGVTIVAMGWMINKVYSRTRVSTTGVHTQVPTDAADMTQTTRKRWRADQDVRVDEEDHNFGVRADNPGKSQANRPDRECYGQDQVIYKQRIFITAEDDKWHLTKDCSAIPIRSGKPAYMMPRDLCKQCET